MKNTLSILAILLLFAACNVKENKTVTELKKEDASSLVGSWKVLKGVQISGEDTVVNDYTNNQEILKVISPTHFSFFRHDLSKGKDSTAIFVSGGGKCTLSDSLYTEHLDYCNYREWEGASFDFTYEFKGDTLITKGVEKLEEKGIDRINIEFLIPIE